MLVEKEREKRLHPIMEEVIPVVSDHRRLRGDENGPVVDGDETSRSPAASAWKFSVHPSVFGVLTSWIDPSLVLEDFVFRKLPFKWKTQRTEKSVFLSKGNEAGNYP